jgi:hypothetical protein
MALPSIKQNDCAAVSPATMQEICHSFTHCQQRIGVGVELLNIRELKVINTTVS